MTSATLENTDSIPPSSSNTTISIPSVMDKENSSNFKGKANKKKMNKILKIFLYILGFILFVLLIYTIWTLICNYRENNILNEYDKAHSNKIEIDGHRINYSIVGDNHNTTIFLFPGFATFAPVIEFKSLAEGLSEKYRIITIEPFGYGFSDVVDKERTLENIVSEFHECTTKFGVDKYYVMGHSIAGMYGVEWANLYPNEILGFIGLDVSVPKQENSPSFTRESLEMYDSYAFYRKIGLIRLANVFNSETSLFAIDPNYKNYTEEEKEMVKFLAANRSYNKSIINEKNHIFEHLSKIYNKKFPENIPVLNFINADLDPLWTLYHKEVITNKTHSEAIEINGGGHFLHITFRDIVLKKIMEWIN